MKGDINCHTSNKKFREGHDNIAWDGEGVETLIENAGDFTLEKVQDPGNEMKHYISELKFSGQE